MPNPSRTILVIDDDPDIRGGLTTILEEQGYRVVTASDGKSGLQMARDELPDLLILDMMMPRMSGFSVLERLKERPGPNPAVVMLSANASVHQRALAHLLGVDIYLHKPVGAALLLDHVQRLCPTNEARA